MASKVDYTNINANALFSQKYIPKIFFPVWVKIDRLLKSITIV